MNRVAVILNYFRYLLNFSRVDTSNAYYFLTTRKRYHNNSISNLYFVDGKKNKSQEHLVNENAQDYFRFSKAIKSFPLSVDIHALAGYYEKYLERFFEKEKINYLFSGGITGFERIGLSIAKKMGIKTFCIWEGFFRPDTLSIDPDGMNAESSFMKISFNDLMRHQNSQEYETFYKRYCKNLHENTIKKRQLREIHGKKFHILEQLGNRWMDRSDIERVRLPLHHHLQARISYNLHSYTYKTLKDITKPFIFFPLQTHTDSNVVLNADLFPYSKYVSLVQKAFHLIGMKNDIQLVIKEHPFDVLRIAYSRKNTNDILWIHPAESSPAILQHRQCLGCVVVNSTAGLESLIIGKPVLCLGKAIYGKEEIVEKNSSDKIEEMAGAMMRLLSQKVDFVKVQQFCGALYDRMQIPLNIESIPQGIDVEVFWDKIKNR